MTNQQHKDVISLHNNGWSYRQIAEKFGVNKNTVRGIIKKHEASNNINSRCQNL